MGMTELPVPERDVVITVSLEDLPAFLRKNGLHIREVTKDLFFIFIFSFEKIGMTASMRADRAAERRT